MNSSIVSQTLQEHAKLIGLIDHLVGALRRLPNDVQWGSSLWLPDSEILDFIRIQTFSLQSAKETTIQGYYRDAYHLIRMVFEGYLLLRLISTCDKYPLRIKLRRTKSDPSLNHAKNRIIQEAQQNIGNRLVKTFMEDNNTLVAVVRGQAVVDDAGKDTGVTLPFYYKVWRQFRPLEYHVKRETLQHKLPTLRFLKGEWADLSKAIKNQPNQDYGLLYKHFLTFDRILENLRLNGVLNKRSTTMVLVHYNFLSNFSHSTSDSIQKIGNVNKFSTIGGDGLSISYDHYYSELALLYVCYLLSMHLEHAIYYLTRWRSIRLQNERKLYRSLCRKVKEDFGYFWFIFNKPSQYDRYEHANRKSSYKKRKIYRPGDIRPGDVRYYDDPLYRLKQLHHHQRELITGNTYDSPFPRNDASF